MTLGYPARAGALAPKLAGLSEQQRIAAETALLGSHGYELFNATLLAGTPGYVKAAAAADLHLLLRDGDANRFGPPVARGIEQRAVAAADL